MAEWYVPGTKRGREPQETWAEYCKGHFEMVRTSSVYHGDDENGWTDALELGDIMLAHYRETYGTDDNWDILAPEQTFRVLIPSPGDPNTPMIDYRGTFDGVYRDLEDGKFKLVDHKTAGQISTNHLALDDQAGSYVTVATHILRKAGLLAKGERIAGIEYNFLAKRKPDARPRDSLGRYLNKDGSISKVQPKGTLLREFITRTPSETNRQIKRIADEAAAMELYRNGTLSLIKNPTRDCSWDCDFFELCQVEEAGGDVDDYIRMVFNVEDPYADHRTGARNTKESVEASRKKG